MVGIRKNGIKEKETGQRRKREMDVGTAEEKKGN